jgi:hypothetical protein
VIDGLALVDEAIVTTYDGGLTPLSGNLYCHTIAACHDVVDVRPEDPLDASRRSGVGHTAKFPGPKSQQISRRDSLGVPLTYRGVAGSERR